MTESTPPPSSPPSPPPGQPSTGPRTSGWLPRPATGTARARSGASEVPWRWQFSVTIAVLAAFALFGFVMILAADVADTVWKNRMAVFSSFEAIVFTAVGWLFGREVNRSEAASAKQDAAAAKEDATRAEESRRVESAARSDAEKVAAKEQQRSQALVAAVETGVVGGPGRPPGASQDARPQGGASQDATARPRSGDPLREFARRLYPELYDER